MKIKTVCREHTAFSVLNHCRVDIFVFWTVSLAENVKY